MDRQLTSPKRRRTTVEEVNHLDRLPEDILLIIFDKLPVEAAICLSLASRKWEDLWKLKDRIDMGYSWALRTHTPVLLSLFSIFYAHQKPTISSVSVACRHDPSMYFEVGLLMALSSWKNVEEIYLDLNDKEDRSKRWTRRYPFVLFSEHEFPPCNSLTKLTMKFLHLETLPPFRFRALRELFLEHVMLFENAVFKITANCPFLVLLSLYNCNQSMDMNVIVAQSSSLLHLIIKEEFTKVRYRRTKMFVRAVNVRTVEFGSALPRDEYYVEGGRECSEAIFRLNEMHHSKQALRVTSNGLLGDYYDKMCGIFSPFSFVQVLKLSSWCIQVLSIEAVKFNPPPHFGARQLVLETGLKKWEYPGVAYLLLACGNLENIVFVIGDRPKLKFDYVKGRTYVREADHIYPGAMEGLTMVEFRNYSGDYQTWEDDNFDVEKFIGGSKYASHLIWNLGTHAKNLSRMVFVSGTKHFETNQFKGLGKLISDRPPRRVFNQVPDLFVRNCPTCC